MADVVTIYTAAISAAAGLGGATITQYIGVIREGRQVKRDRSERYVEATRQACLSLLQAAGDLRNQVANSTSYRGPDMRARLEEMRTFAEAAQLHAASVALLMPEEVARKADELAGAASTLAEWAVKNTNLELRGMNDERPDFSQLSMCITAFRAEAVSALKPPPEKNDEALPG
jgi:hypothetical protein